MARPWEVSADDIVNWASSVSAAATLPKLVRRLLFATAPLRTLVMRADAGVRLAGWDGVVESFRTTRFCPSGISYWELSVDAEVKPKLDRDFRKYIILGACNPALADRALHAELEAGLLLPCNVIVYEADSGESVVAAIAPLAALGIVGDNMELGHIAREADRRLRAALTEVERA